MRWTTLLLRWDFFCGFNTTNWARFTWFWQTMKGHHSLFPFWFKYKIKTHPKIEHFVVKSIYNSCLVQYILSWMAMRRQKKKKKSNNSNNNNKDNKMVIFKILEQVRHTEPGLLGFCNTHYKHSHVQLFSSTHLPSCSPCQVVAMTQT